MALPQLEEASGCQEEHTTTMMGSEPFTRGNRFLFALGQRQVERMIVNF